MQFSSNSSVVPNRLRFKPSPFSFAPRNQSRCIIFSIFVHFQRLFGLILIFLAPTYKGSEMEIIQLHVSLKDIIVELVTTKRL